MPIIPLSMLNSGEEGIIVRIHAGRGLARRLAELGLNPNTKVRVLNSTRGMPFIIIVRDTRLVLGWGIASKILMEVK